MPSQEVWGEHISILFSAFAAMLIAQGIKVGITSVELKIFAWRRFFESGGFPSSHSAVVAALVVSVGITQGMHSVAFAISAVLAGIVMFDSIGVRRCAGEQARVINQLLVHLQLNQEKGLQTLKERIGHSQREMWGGCLLGVLIATLLNWFF